MHSEAQARRFGKDLLRRFTSKKSLFQHGSGDRTKKARAILHTMAVEWQCKLHPYKPRERREFLCDFVWLLWSKERRALRRAVFAAECEWSARPTSILYDFRKLMLLKADLKLCIYQIAKGAKPEHAASIRADITRALRAYEQYARGEHYFLLELHRKEGKLKLFHLSVHPGGAVGSVEITPP